MAKTSNIVKDQLRFQAAVNAQKLALQKWDACAYGINQIEDKDLRDKARKLHAAISWALQNWHDDTRA